MDWSILHALNDFLYHHDGVEDPLLFYVNASEALFIATPAVIFLPSSGVKYVFWRRATVAATLSVGLALDRQGALRDLPLLPAAEPGVLDRFRQTTQLPTPSLAPEGSEIP